MIHTPFQFAAALFIVFFHVRKNNFERGKRAKREEEKTWNPIRRDYCAIRAKNELLPGWKDENK
jgi:hypothetical protein